MVEGTVLSREGNYTVRVAIFSGNFCGCELWHSVFVRCAKLQSIFGNGQAVHPFEDCRSTGIQPEIAAHGFQLTRDLFEVGRWQRAFSTSGAHLATMCLGGVWSWGHKTRSCAPAVPQDVLKTRARFGGFRYGSGLTRWHVLLRPKEPEKMILMVNLAITLHVVWSCCN